MRTLVPLVLVNLALAGLVAIVWPLFNSDQAGVRLLALVAILGGMAGVVALFARLLDRSD